MAIVTQYSAEGTGYSVNLILDERKKPTLTIKKNDEKDSKQICTFRNHDSVATFCKALGMVPPSWIGKTHLEAIKEEIGMTK